eukprot:SAG22_NODE_1460_length_4373_cov_4.000702_1_plen_472_part_00
MRDFIKLTEDSHVPTLTQENIEEFIESHIPTMIEFYAPWCGHCKTLAPEYGKASTALERENITIAKLDVPANTEINELPFADGLGGFPTILIFKEGNPKKFKPYTGARNTQGIVGRMKAVQQHLEKKNSKRSVGGTSDKADKSPPDAAPKFTPLADTEPLGNTWVGDSGEVNHLTAASWSDFRTDHPHTLVFFFKDDCAISRGMMPAYAEASTLLKNDLAIAAVDCGRYDADSVCEKYTIEQRGFPTLLWFASSTDDGSEVRRVKKSPHSIRRYAQRQVNPLWQPSPSDCSSMTLAESPWPDTGRVLHLDDDTFECFRQTHQRVLAMFYGNSPLCDAAIPVLVAESMAGPKSVSFVAVNCDDARDVCDDVGVTSELEFRFMRPVSVNGTGKAKAYAEAELEGLMAEMIEIEVAVEDAAGEDAAVERAMGRGAVSGDQAGTAVEDDEIDAMLAEELELDDLFRDSDQPEPDS